MRARTTVIHQDGVRLGGVMADRTSPVLYEPLSVASVISCDVGYAIGVAMRATTVRFGDDLWDLMEAEALEQGISAEQFVRGAAIMRVGVISRVRGELAVAMMV